MNRRLRILCIEDDEADYCLIVRHLTKHGTIEHCQRVASLAHFTSEMDAAQWDLVLLDYNVPGVGIPQVLAQTRKYVVEIPVILVSGGVGEEAAIDLLKQGIADFVLKNSLARLVPAIERCSREIEERQARLQAQAELARHKRLLEAIVEGTTDAIFVKSCDGRYVLCNSATAHFTGRESSEIIGQDDFSIFPATVAEHIRGLDASIMESGRTQTHEETVTTPSGQERTFLVTKGPVLDSAGRPIGIFAISRDITERKAMEDALRESDKRTALILATAPGAMLVVNSTGRIVQANTNACQLFRRSEVELAGLNIEALIPHRLRDRYSAFWAAYLSAPSTATLGDEAEFHALAADGTEFPVELGLGPVHLEGELHIIINITDITVRKQAEAVRRESEEALARNKIHLEKLVSERTVELREQAGYLRALIDHFPFQVWLKDTTGRYLAVNKTTTHGPRGHGRIHRYVGKTDAEIWPTELVKRYEAEDAKVMATRQPLSVEEAVRNPHAGAWREIYKAPVVDDRGVLLGTVGFSRDISDRKAAEEAREKALREAERLIRVRGEFLANMSHEIRTPLNAILGFTQVGLRDSHGRQIHQTFSHILKSGKHLLGIINDILDFSKIEADKLAIEQRDFVLSEVIDDSIELVANQAYAKGLDLQVDEAPDLPVTINGDPTRLGQVLVNLLSNAIKFTLKGQVTLTIGKTPSTLIFQIKDTGIGISDEALSRLFQSFTQADSSTTRRFGGSGLGLVISKRLVELMGGTIKAASVPGMGSCFEVCLPVDSTAGSTCPILSGHVLLAGLAEKEAAYLAESLKQRGLSTSITTPQLAFAIAADFIVLDLRSVRDPEVAKAMDRAVDEKRKLALVSVPSGDPAWFNRHAESIPILERPLRTSQVLKAMYSNERGVPTIRGRKRLAGAVVLAVEDEEVNRMVLRELLAAEGARLTIVDSGPSALERLMTAGPETYDVVLMDIQMPEMDGYEATRRIRQIAPTLPVIGLTAHAMAEDHARCLEAGMVDHIAKPLDLNVVTSAIQSHMNRHTPGVGSVVRATTHGRSGDDGPVRSETPAPVDWTALEHRFKNNRQFVRKLCDTLSSSHADTGNKLRGAAKRCEYKLLASLAHGLNGVSANLMANAVNALAIELELAAKAQLPAAKCLAEQLADALDDLLAKAAKYSSLSEEY